jgi:transcriptional regulator of arginine metabolism
MLSNQARRKIIREFIIDGEVYSQNQLMELLRENGIEVTQATVSRDLEEIGAIRRRGGEGDLKYFLDGVEKIHSQTQSRGLIKSAQASGNLVVLLTPPGGAQLLASEIDSATHQGKLKRAIGTIAGDDTVLVIASTATGGVALQKEIESYYSNPASASLLSTSRKGK